MQFWNELEGKVLDNLYPLRRLVRSEGRTAWFETEMPNGGGPALISLTESLTDTNEVKGRLEAAQKLKSPSLLEIRAIGQARLDQTPCVYAIMEPADQNLSDVLRGRILSKEEARPLAEAMVGALTAIHQHNMAHGRVEPASILAVGDAIKLRSDCLQSPGATRAGDVAGLGATLFQSFTQRAASSADDAQINRIPAPFGEIIRNSLSSRWGLAQIAVALQPPSASLPAAAKGPSAMPSPVPPGGGKGAVPAVPVQSVPAKTVASPTKMQEEPLSSPQPPPDVEEAARHSRRVGLWVGLAILVLAVIAWLTFRSKTPAPRSNAAPIPLSPPAPSPSAQGGPSTDQLPSKPSVATAKPPASVESLPRPATVAGAQATWRVVAYTYHHPDQAQHKADMINSAHPELHAEVFHPNGDSMHYMVVLGGAMESHDAFRMKEKAVRAGLASDTYVENFPE